MEQIAIIAAAAEAAEGLVIVDMVVDVDGEKRMHPTRPRHVQMMTLGCRVTILIWDLNNFPLVNEVLD
jgi:hypothetical protein